MSEASLVPGQNIPIKTLPNLRDLGGYATADGSTVKRGILYRSVGLGRLDDEDLTRLEELRIETIFDLRTAAEREASPDREIGAREIALDVLAGDEGSAAANITAIVTDPGKVDEMLGGGRGADLLQNAYRQLIQLPSARDSYSRFFTELAGEADLPALFHCTTGKDRTGWAAASTLLFLGVSEEDVYHDYLLTNKQLLPALEPMLDEFKQAGGNPELLRPVLGVDRAYLTTAIELMKTEYGTIDAYMSEGLQLDDALLAELRSRLLSTD